MNRSRNPQPRQLNRIPVVLAALVAGGAFLYMVKLMDTMTGHMATIASRIVSMSTELETMRAHMGQLTGEVSDIAAQVHTLPAMASDLHRMREGMEQLSGVVQRGSDQMQRMEQLSPMGVIQQMLPGTSR